MTNQSHGNINPQNLIPEYWHGIYVPTEEDLIFLGSQNITYLKTYWESEGRGLAASIRRAEDDINLLAGKTPDDIKMMAAGYDDPKFPKIGVPADAWGNNPEPLDAASINRKAGATTFNVCGWCEHHGGGTCRYNYHITTYCPLIPREFGNGERYGANEEFHFNTPCALKNGTQGLLDACVKYLEARKAKLVARQQQVADYVSYLARIANEAEEKPYFAYHRPYDWFNLDDHVMFFISDFNGVLPEKVNTFVSGRVINGYRHHDGCVSVCANEPFHSGEYCDGCGSGYGASRPEVLNCWEYEYLKSHPNYLKVWMRCAKAELSKFDSESFEKALLNDKG